MTTNSHYGFVARALPAGLLMLSGLALAAPKPNEPAHGWIPTPHFTSPVSQQKFEPGPSLSVHIKAMIPAVNPGGYTVPGPFDFVAYAKASPFTEKWHVHIVKQGNGGSQELLQTFEGLVTGNTFSVALDSAWLAKHGPGKFGAIGFITQTTPKGLDKGMSTGVGFEIPVPQASAKLSPQTLGSLVAKPMGATSAPRSH